MSNTALANQPDTLAHIHSPDEQWLVQLLVDAGLKGSDSELTTLARRFQEQPHTLKLVAAYLKRWYAGRLNGLETVPGLTECEDDETALSLVLHAMENKLRDTSDLTLIYLLSLSDRPVPQEHMQNVFRSTFMERWLTRRDDYVRFLGPLGRLNEDNWHWVTENLRRLQLLEQPIAGQYDLLFVDEPIRRYFSRNMRERSTHVFEQATGDMEKLFKDTVVDFRQRYRSTPEIKTWISPELQQSLERADSEAEENAKASLWKPDEIDTAQYQLGALRSSLGTLKEQAERLQKQLHQNDDSPASTTKPDKTIDPAETTTGKGAV